MNEVIICSFCSCYYHDLKSQLNSCIYSSLLCTYLRTYIYHIYLVKYCTLNSSCPWLVATMHVTIVVINARPPINAAQFLFSFLFTHQYLPYYKYIPYTPAASFINMMSSSNISIKHPTWKWYFVKMFLGSNPQKFCARQYVTHIICWLAGWQWNLNSVTV